MSTVTNESRLSGEERDNFRGENLNNNNKKNKKKSTNYNAREWRTDYKLNGLLKRTKGEKHSSTLKKNWQDGTNKGGRGTGKKSVEEGMKQRDGRLARRLHAQPWTRSLQNKQETKGQKLIRHHTLLTIKYLDKL